jgi:hypothetical protein
MDAKRMVDIGDFCMNSCIIFLCKIPLMNSQFNCAIELNSCSTKFE